MRLFSAIVRLVLIIAVVCFVVGVSRSIVGNSAADQSFASVAPAPAAVQATR
jgi:hypothetical protein